MDQFFHGLATVLISRHLLAFAPVVHLYGPGILLHARLCMYMWHDRNFELFFVPLASI